MKWQKLINIILFTWLAIATFGQIAMDQAFADLIGKLVDVDNRMADLLK